MDLTRNIQRKKEKELAALQFVGGEASTAKQPVLAKKSRPERSLPLREREEVQKMLRLLIGLLSGLAAHAAIFPDAVQNYQKGPVKAILTPDQPLEDEFGLDATEQAEYSAGPKRFIATAWRFHDSTGAMAMFESLRPPGAKPAKFTRLSVSTSDGVIFAYGNYVFQITGSVPPPADFEELYARLPKLDQSPLPALMGDLPTEGLIPNSERYILGPVSLARFDRESRRRWPRFIWEVKESLVSSGPIKEI